MAATHTGLAGCELSFRLSKGSSLVSAASVCSMATVSLYAVLEGDRAVEQLVAEDLSCG